MDAMGIWSTTWAARVFVEAMKFWFYSLICSLALSQWKLYELMKEPKIPSVPLSEKSEKVSAAAKKALKKQEQAVLDLKAKRQAIMKTIVIDGCDLLIPGFVTGWLDTSSAMVGFAGILSTLLASGDVWKRVQKAAA
jgi:hypothetical protein